MPISVSGGNLKLKSLKRLLGVLLCVCIASAPIFLTADAAETKRPYGDVDNDGKVNSADALTVLKMATGITEPDADAYKYGDCDRDSKLNSADALMILNYSVGYNIELTSFWFGYEEKSVLVGSEFQQYVTYFRPILADSEKLNWTSSDFSVASVTAGGRIKALKIGETVITCSSVDNPELTASFRLLVKPYASSVSLSKTAVTLKQGSSLRLTASVKPDNAYNKKVKWKSSDDSVATVDSNGNVKAKMIGTAKITAFAADGSGKSASCSITVTAMSIPYVSQLPDYPTGCEAASCCMLLKYYGFSITLNQMISIIPRKNLYTKNGKTYGPDINEMFVGDPRCTYTSSTPGYGVFSPAVTKALQKAIDQRSGGYTAVKISGCSFNELLSKVSAGHPVIVWATYKMKNPTQVNAWYIEGTGKYFEYPRGTHVMILSGYSKDSVVTVDPYGNGVLEFSRDLFNKRWELLGRQAIILEKNS